MAQPVSRDVRRAKFAEFVARAMHRAKSRGMTVDGILEATGVSRTTLYRWRKGDWQDEPRPNLVVAFCDELGEDTQEAFSILWPSKQSPLRREPTRPEPLHPTLRTIARMLTDPNVSAEDKRYIERNLLQLAATPTEPPPQQSRRGHRASGTA